jgi:death-on-curing protein
LLLSQAYPAPGGFVHIKMRLWEGNVREGGNAGIQRKRRRTARMVPVEAMITPDSHMMIMRPIFSISVIIIRSHPFVDGSKRAGAVAAVVFLMMNGRELHTGEESFEAMVRAVAEKKLDKAGTAEFFRKHARGQD